MSDKVRYEDLTALIKRRGQEVLRKFGQVALADITDAKLLSVLHCVKAYWPDIFRPALTSLCCEAVGGRPEAADDVSLMVTLASSGGGIHDDIIDKSLQKHFRTTVLGLHGLDYTLLAGDLLIVKGWAKAYELFKNGLPVEKVARVIEVFGKWTADVCVAEFMEISCRKNLDTNLDHYQKILRQSMADIEGCAKLGSIVGEGSEKEIEELGEFGSCLGYAFRLEDDVKDSFDVEFNLTDRLMNESVPLPILFAAKSSKTNYNSVKTILEKPALSGLDIKQLQNLCYETGAFEFMLKVAIKNEKEALKKLNLLKPSEARNTLFLLAKKSIEEISKLCS